MGQLQEIKGIYDTEGVKPRLLVTGSSRQDVYRKGGDSLAGRFYSYRLHPLSVAEVKEKYSGQNSGQNRDSSKPPSMDPNRRKKPIGQGGRKPGGQQGRSGTTLQPVPDPDEIKVLPVDRSALPRGRYKEAGYEARQVIDLKISRVVTEYRAEILKDQHSKRYVAPFPDGVTRPVQYGNSVKGNSVYMSQYQLIPYNRIDDRLLTLLCNK